jgi:cell division protease FtsH
MTPGMVGADLANVVNEAALSAARRNVAAVAQRDLVAAVDRMQLGLEKKGVVMSPGEKERVAIHESGHTLVALSMKSSDPVHRVTIIPRSIGALGATLQLPTDDKRLLTVTELRDRLCVMLGGRMAEMLLLGEPSTGAQNDLERASETVRAMACRFGMSDRLGPLTFGRATTLRFLGDSTEERNYSEETARAIDAEVRRIIEEENARARTVLSKRRRVLRAIADALLVKETLEREELDEIVTRAEEESDDEDGPSFRDRARSPRQASRP